MSAKLLAVVGTDTGVGKTVISAGLLQGLRDEGLRVAAFKPVETGLPTPHATTEGETPDWVRLARVTGQPPESCLGVSFPLPAAPLAAARAANARIDLDRLQARLAELRHQHDLVLVEGAGGLCVPFAKGLLWADLLERWQPECIVVGRLSLGTVNHTLLTVRELQHRDLVVYSIILNTLVDPKGETPQTPALISAFSDVAVEAVNRRGTTEPSRVADTLREAGVIERLTSRYRND